MRNDRNCKGEGFMSLFFSGEVYFGCAKIMLTGSLFLE